MKYATDGEGEGERNNTAAAAAAVAAEENTLGIARRRKRRAERRGEARQRQSVSWICGGRRAPCPLYIRSIVWGTPEEHPGSSHRRAHLFTTRRWSARLLLLLLLWDEWKEANTRYYDTDRKCLNHQNRLLLSSLFRHKGHGNVSDLQQPGF